MLYFCESLQIPFLSPPTASHLFDKNLEEHEKGPQLNLCLSFLKAQRCSNPHFFFLNPLDIKIFTVYFSYTEIFVTLVLGSIVLCCLKWLLFWQEVCDKEITLTSGILFVTLHFHPTCLSASPRFWLCQTAPWPTRRRWGNTACQSGYLSDVSTNTGHTTFTRKGSATRWNCQQEKSHHWQTQKVSLTLNVFYLRDLY